jgi:FtsP/CotA-like multicopper oxidase with cupredoxin domain
MLNSFKSLVLRTCALNILFVIFFVSAGFSNQSEERIYINRGEMLAVDSTYMPYLAFNESNMFNKTNTFIELNIGDTLKLMVINTDTINHDFAVKNQEVQNTTILALDSTIITFTFNDAGAFIFYDPSENERFRYLGLASMIIVKNPSHTNRSFYWNIKDHNKSFNTLLNQGNSVSWTDYYPTYFTINGNSNPSINQDPLARVTGSVGDTIRVYMVNTGQAIHSIHFHGYHSSIIQSSKFPAHAGRSKDTFPVYSMELVVIELIPDKVGEYPVHDHNLVAVTGGNMYPNGMFLTMLIQ